MDDKAALLWERYKHDVELHRSYLDLVIRINVFYYAITGAIISFYFLNFEDEPLLRFSLVLPFFMSVGLAIFFWGAASAAKPSQDELDRLTISLGFKVGSVVADVLAFLLRIFFVMFILVAIGLIVIFFRDLDFCKYLFESCAQQ